MSLPNDIPESVMALVGQIAEKPHLQNYEKLKQALGPACALTKKAAEIFIYEHTDALRALRKALNELGPD
jgi:hypothetical protein